MIDSQFLSNEANISSTIDVLGASSYLINYIQGCTFRNNSAIKNTISLNKARALITSTKFRDNFSKERSKNIFVAFAEVNISDSEFSSPEYFNIQRELDKDFTMGAFLFIILDVQIIIRNTKFVSGLAKYGGAIYVSGQSEITLDSCQLIKNKADLYGGAIFANGFKSIKVINGTRLLDNLANF
jgi:predicted outer membrane repeat protein